MDRRNRPSEELTATAVPGPDTRSPQEGVRLYAVWNGGSFTTGLPPRGTADIGRAGECLVCIDHRSVSRTHARLVLGPRITVEDLGSSNGTWANGRRLAPREPAEIGPGSVVEVGSVLLVLQAASREDATAPSVPSSAMSRVTELASVVAKSSISVILLGETGVGKGFFARQIHASSSRAKRPLVELNCAALTETLLESELFGHERGAFTGATTTKAGLLETADGGTMFLDEIGELPLTMQAKLLRVLESGEVMRVGGTKPRKVDVRYVSATNRDLRALVERGLFREDLFFRIDGFSITIPPLRERIAEIEPLALRFLAEAPREVGPKPSRFAADALLRLRQHPWPGNIRELRNVVTRSALLASGDTLRADALELVGEVPAHAPPTSASSDDPERARILAALDRCAGNQTRAAKLLGISRRTLVTRIESYGVPRPKKG